MNDINIHLYKKYKKYKNKYLLLAYAGAAEPSRPLTDKQALNALNIKYHSSNMKDIDGNPLSDQLYGPLGWRDIPEEERAQIFTRLKNRQRIPRTDLMGLALQVNSLKNNLFHCRETLDKINRIYQKVREIKQSKGLHEGENHQVPEELWTYDVFRRPVDLSEERENQAVRDREQERAVLGRAFNPDRHQ